VLQKAGVTGWQCGHTKVFLRYYHMDELNRKFLPFPLAAQKLTKVARGFMARSAVRKLLNEKQRKDKLLDSMLVTLEKQVASMKAVVLALCEEDEARPLDFFIPKVYKDPKMKKIAKEVDKKGFTRAQSVRWFKEVEMKKGAGVADNGKFEEWFHGVITRKQSEDLLQRKKAGTFLVRVSESRFGYSLSHQVKEGSRVKHYMVDQTHDGQYQVIGNRKLFPSLNDLVAFHNTNKIVAEDDVCLLYPCGQVRRLQGPAMGFTLVNVVGALLGRRKDKRDVLRFPSFFRSPRAVAHTLLLLTPLLLRCRRETWTTAWSWSTRSI
jgi:myosin-3